MTRWTFVPTIAAALLTARGAVAQAPSTQVPAAKATVASIQPLSAMFSVYSLEVEHAVSPVATVGLGGSYWGAAGDLTYASGDLKLRYYPEGHPFQGFSFGGQIGYTRVTDTQMTYDVNGVTGSQDQVTSGPTFGVALDYGWLLGQTKSFYVGLGLGAKKIFAGNSNNSDVQFAYPTARISVGVAF